MTRIASHRGGTLEYGDSTPRGFRATALMGVEEVEFDVHPTIDDAIMVHHDPTLDRTTDGTGPLATQTEAEIRAATIHYSGGENPISLAELCEIYRQSHVDFRCEIKPGVDGRAYTGFVPHVVDTLEREGMLARTTFSSFLYDTLREQRQHTGRPVLWLVSPQVLRQVGPQGVLTLARDAQVPEIGVNIDTADAVLRDLVQAAGLDFGCWAAHTRAQIDKALDLSVKVFTTDRPTLALRRREARA